MPISNGFHWSVNARNQRVTQTRADLPYKGAFFSKVLAPAAGEKVQVDSVVGRKTISYAYAFQSANAWIRGQPESGTTMLSIIGGDSADLQPIGYYDKTKGDSVTAYEDLAAQLTSGNIQEPTQILPYRYLNPADLDMASGFSQLFMGLTDVWQARGGLSHLEMASTKTTVETPQLEVHGPHHQLSTHLSDELRFGTVRRATAGGSPTTPDLIRVGTNFAKEHTMVLGWAGQPNTLVDCRQGIVVEDDGTQAKGAGTGKPLRSRALYNTTVDRTLVEVDENGNLHASTALDATTGVALEIGQGHLRVDTGLSQTLRSRQDAEFSSSLGRVLISAQTGFQVSTPATGEVSADLGLDLRSVGPVRIISPIPSGIRLGDPNSSTMYPVLVANPQYLTAQSSWLGDEIAFMSAAASYGGSAGAAWASIGALAAALDPSGTVTSQCMAAGGAAVAMAAAATTAVAATSAYMLTLSPQPAGYISTKTLSE
jgi:hypothetical protein